MSDFTAMAGQLARLSSLQLRARAAGDLTSESGHVRKFLVDGPKSSEELQKLTGLTSKQVWGRLKYDLQQGRVKRNAEDKFELEEVDQEAIDRAVKLLRRNGYAVTRIKRNAAAK